MTGIDNLIYMSSKSDSSGMSTITLTFEVGTDPDVAHMQVQNKVQQVQSQLPSAVQSYGVSVSKGNDNMFMVISLFSPDDSQENIDLADYISTNINREPTSGGSDPPQARWARSTGPRWHSSRGTPATGTSAARAPHAWWSWMRSPLTM